MSQVLARRTVAGHGILLVQSALGFHVAVWASVATIAQVLVYQSGPITSESYARGQANYLYFELERKGSLTKDEVDELLAQHENDWQDSQVVYCSLCDAAGHGQPGYGPCPLEERGADEAYAEAQWEAARGVLSYEAARDLAAAGA
jgi:hypothetical protein